MKILDMSAGNRAIWFDKNNPLCTYIDIREGLAYPNVTMDSTNMHEFKAKTFDLILFDPPHVNAGKNSNTSKTYGHHTTKRIREIISGSAKEANRVSKHNALMAFKWNDHDQKLPSVLKLMSDYWLPLFGALTKDGPKPASKTYWCLLLRKEL